MKNVLASGLFLAIAIIASTGMIAAIGFLGLQQHYQLAETKAKNEAIDACFEAAQIETTYLSDDDAETAVTIEPIREIYTLCLQDKGIQ